MRRFYFLLIFFPVLLLANESSPSTRYRGYLNNLEDGEIITVYSKPGVNWRTCKKGTDKNGVSVCTEAMGWLDRNAEVTVIGPPVQAETENPITSRKEKKKYVEIEFTYERNGRRSGRGFIELNSVFKAPMKAFYSTQNIATGTPASGKEHKNCPPPGVDSKKKETQGVFQPLTEAIRNLGVNQSADELKKIVGVCLTNPPDKFPNPLPSGNAYDGLVYGTIAKIKPPRLMREDGSQMTQQDLIDIDAIARTLYGEMGGCYSRGLHYPMAVARIILNRSIDKKNFDLFVQQDGPKEKPVLSRIATKPSQFSMWISKKANRPLHQGLCPGRVKGEPFYHGPAASQEEQDIWTNTVRIATEAVLYPEQFKRRTAQVKYTHYTSNLGHLRNQSKLPKAASFINFMNQRSPQIDGRTIGANECLEIWEENPHLMKRKLEKERIARKNLGNI